MQRLEAKMERIEIIRPRFGQGLKRRCHEVGGKPMKLTVEGEQEAPPQANVLGKKPG
jgi:hypothetical protein